MPRLSKRLNQFSILACVAVLCPVCIPTYASVLTADAGNTQPGCVFANGCSVAVGVEATVDFAVYTNTNGSRSPDPFGTGYSNFKNVFTAGTSSAAFDPTAKYLYLYETVNNGNNAANYQVSSNAVATIPANATSWGSFTVPGTSLGFVLSSGVLGSPAAGFSSRSPATTGANPTITAQTGLIAPTTIALTDSSVVASYLGNLLGANQDSTLWGFTSNTAPVFVSTSIQDGGTSGIGTVPGGGVPEAATVFLTGTGGVLLALASLLRRRRQSRKI